MHAQRDTYKPINRAFHLDRIYSSAWKFMRHCRTWTNTNYGEDAILKGWWSFPCIFFSSCIRKHDEDHETKSVAQRFWSSCFSPKHLGGCYNSLIYYHIYIRIFPCHTAWVSLSLTSFSNSFNFLCGDLFKYLAEIQNQILFIDCVQAACDVSTWSVHVICKTY